MDIWEKLELHNNIYINTVLSTLQPLPIVRTYRNQRNASGLILLLICDLQRQHIRINVVKYETMRIYKSQIHLSSRVSTLKMLAVRYNIGNDKNIPTTTMQLFLEFPELFSRNRIYAIIA